MSTVCQDYFDAGLFLIGCAGLVDFTTLGALKVPQAEVSAGRNLTRLIMFTSKVNICSKALLLLMNAVWP